MNHLEDHQRGDIIVDGVLLNADTRNIDAVRCNISIVFQHFNPFPHLSMLGNITLVPIKFRKLKRKQPRNELARSDMTALAVTQQMGFPREFADRTVSFHEGQIVEDRAPEQSFSNPRYTRTKAFLEQVP